MTRRSAFIFMSENNDDSEDYIISYCSKCQSFGFLSELKERIYNTNEPIPSDSDNWLQCHRCGLVVAKVHAKWENEIVGIKDVSDSTSIYDSGKTVIETVNSGKYHTSKRRQFIKNLNRIDHRTNKPEDKIKTYNVC